VNAKWNEKVDDLSRKCNIKHVRLNTEDLHKLKKHKVMRVDDYVIHIDDVMTPKVKLFGKRGGL